MLGLPSRFHVDLSEAERRFKELSRQLHPDRFVLADARERRYSLMHSTALNDAWRTVRDRRKRAEYLLALWGRPMTDSSSRTQQLPLSFLEEVMEIRERLAEAKMASDRPALEAEVARIRGILSTLEGQIDAAFTLHEGAEPGQVGPVVDQLEHLLHRQRYLSNIVNEHGSHPGVA